jgi:uncharacterized protein (TIGR02118 family)
MTGHTRIDSALPFGHLSKWRYGPLMTVKLVVLYTHPDDPDTFDEHYLRIHGPLVDAIPGLLRWEGARILGTPDGGDHTYSRIAELYFADRTALQDGLGSDAGVRAADDFQQIAPPGSRMYVAALD